jgi:hypothetical protein
MGRKVPEKSRNSGLGLAPESKQGVIIEPAPAHAMQALLCKYSSHCQSGDCPKHQCVTSEAMVTSGGDSCVWVTAVLQNPYRPHA